MFFLYLIKYYCFFFKSIGTSNTLYPHYGSTVHHKCLQSMEDAQQMTAFINEGYMRLKPLLYPCTIEFSLMCLTVNI